MNFAELLELLGYANTEHLSLSWQQPGGQFSSVIAPYPLPAAYTPPADRCMWFGANPVRNVKEGRGKFGDITRLATIWCDLDVKPGACRDLDHAHQIIAELSALLGTRPSAIVMSGHGLQPYWPIDDAPLHDDDTRGQAAALLKRWGRLAVLVADGLGAKIDRGVYDLTRVLRVPGSYNHKSEPVLVVATPDTGAPLGLDELAERLDEHSPEIEGDRGEDLNAIVSAPSGWDYSPGACSYTHTMAKGWASDNPADRHPWLVAQATRIACAHRNGCLTIDAHRNLIDALETRFLQLCAQPGRERKLTSPDEVIRALRHGQRIAAVKGDLQLAKELGSHLHLEELAGQQGKASPSEVSPSQVDKHSYSGSATPAPAQTPSSAAAELLADEPKPAAATSGLRAVRASSISTTVPTWAWEYDGQGRILNAAMTLFGGRPEAGKSTTARWFAAGFTNGTLPGCFEGKPIDVAYVATEEAWRHTVVPSLQAAGADLDRVVFIEGEEGQPARIKSIAHEAELTQLFRDENVKAIFLDPLMGTINGGADINRNNEVREYLDPWVRISEAIDGPVVGICHMTKAPTGDVVASITGSSAFGELARCVFGFAVDREADDGTHVMSQAKNSAGVGGLNLAYRIGTKVVTTTDGKSAEMARFELVGPSEKNVRELLIAERSQGTSSGTDECAKWLKGYLSACGRTAREDVMLAAADLGFSQAAVKRAGHRVNVVIERTREVPSRTYWDLPGGGR